MGCHSDPQTVKKEDNSKSRDCEKNLCFLDQSVEQIIYCRASSLSVRYSLSVLHELCGGSSQLLVLLTAQNLVADSSGTGSSFKTGSDALGGGGGGGGGS